MGLFERSGVISSRNKNLLHCMARTIKKLECSDATQISLSKTQIRFTSRFFSMRNFKLLSGISSMELNFSKQNGIVEINYKIIFRWIHFISPLVFVSIWAMMGVSIYAPVIILLAIIFIGYKIQVGRVVSWVQDFVA